MPCRSGCPSGVRGGEYGFAPGFGACALTRTVIASTPVSAISNINRVRICILQSTFQWLLAPLAVHQLFDEFDTLEFHELRILFPPPIQRHAHLPWTRKNVRIVDR